MTWRPTRKPPAAVELDQDKAVSILGALQIQAERYPCESMAALCKHLAERIGVAVRETF
jgi:hypothetical protein